MKAPSAPKDSFVSRICLATGAFAIIVGLPAWSGHSADRPTHAQGPINACTYGASCDVPQRIDTIYDEHDRYVCTQRCDVATPGATTGTWNPLGSQEPR